MSRVVTIHFSPGDELPQCKHELSCDRLMQGGSFSSAPLVLGAFDLFAVRGSPELTQISFSVFFLPYLLIFPRFSYFHICTNLQHLTLVTDDAFGSVLRTCAGAHSIGSHLFHWALSHVGRHVAKKSGLCFSSMELTLEKTTEGRGLNNLPMTKGRDGNSISNEREVPLHFYNAQF